MYNCFTSLLHQEKTNKSLQCDSYKELPLGFLSITNDHKDPRFHIYISIARYIYIENYARNIYIYVNHHLESNVNSDSILYKI